MTHAVPIEHGLDPFGGPVDAGRLSLEFVSLPVAQSILDGDLAVVRGTAGWPHENTLAGMWMVANQGTLSWFAVVGGEVIGEIGTFGPPDENGQVQLGYGFAGGFEGYASDAVVGLTKALLTIPGVVAVVDSMSAESDQRPPEIDGSEADTLLAFIDYLRGCLVGKLDGLSEADARRPLVASGTSILGLVKHVSSIEVFWLHQAFAGESPGAASAGDLTSTDTIDPVRTTYQNVIGHSNAIVRTRPDLTTRAVAAQFSAAPTTLRWILVHLVEEIGRHTGHADILREQIDGTIGR